MPTAQAYAQGGVHLFGAGSVALAMGFERNPRLKENVGYKALHGWVTRHRGRPEVCVDCGAVENLEWSNTNGKYARQLSDFAGRCVPCHRQYDRQPTMRGAIRRKWGKK